MMKPYQTYTLKRIQVRLIVILRARKKIAMKEGPLMPPTSSA
jgi:hypothetical protein